MRHSISVLVLALASLPALAQFHGVPPSVTSLAPGRTSTAPPASVTSMGPFGLHGQGGKFFPRNPLFSPHHPRFRTGFGFSPFGSSVVVVPYYVPYPDYAYSEEAYSDATAPTDAERQQVIMVPYDATAPTDAPAQTAPQAQIAPASAQTPPATVAQQEPTVLVFRDGHRMEVTNYAIVGKELINLSGKGPRRIPLADLDLTATTRENDERGIGFHVPNSF